MMPTVFVVVGADDLPAAVAGRAQVHAEGVQLAVLRVPAAGELDVDAPLGHVAPT